MKNEFDYLLDKISSSEFSNTPFRHIYIENFFTAKHFEFLVQLPEVNIGAVADDECLFNSLFESGYQIINFPGCITDKEKYIEWHSGDVDESHHTATEGFGVTLRLTKPKSQFLVDLKHFLEGQEFNECLAEKMGISIGDCKVDGGIQKYLDGYEISPHPDIRKKAATFMVNINPSELSESADHHTHYLRFKPEREYVGSYWEGNDKVDRCWVPWDWCESVYQQSKNNSIVLFSPANDTVHAVKASYNHLVTQRTQLYGNLWYQTSEVEKSLSWEDFDFQAQPKGSVNNGGVSKAVRQIAKKLGRTISGKESNKATRSVSGK